MVQMHKNSQKKDQRVAKIAHCVEINDVEEFRNLNISKKECLSLRFNYNMNLLQLVCFEEASLILDQMRHKFANDDITKRTLAQHRDSHMGS